MKYGKRTLTIGLLLFAACRNPATEDKDAVMQAGKDYPVYGGNKAGNRYSPLKLLDTQNVKNLQPVWRYFANSTDTLGENDGGREIQCQPIVVHGILYGTSSELNLFALDAATGKQIWK